MKTDSRPLSCTSVDSGCIFEDDIISSMNSTCDQDSCECHTSTRKHPLNFYDIAGKNIKTISPRTFLYYANHIEELNLSRNNIASLPETICELKCLKVLNLSQNELTNIPESWKVLNRLVVLNLSKNKLEESPKCIKLGMQCLTSVDLSGNRLKHLSAPKCLPFLKYLNISYNDFVTLPLWLFSEESRSLKELDVSNNFCFDDVKLETNIYLAKHFRQSSLKSLEKLNLSNTGTKVKNITCLSSFEALQTVIMGNCSPKDSLHLNWYWALSFDFFSNPNKITELHIPNVGLAGIPKDIDRLNNLRVINLSDNPLDWLPESFCELKCLQDITLSNCNILYLPENLKNLTCLTKLVLDSNKLTEVNLSAFTSLNWLDLYNNVLEEFPLAPEALVSSQLEYLDVAYNYFDLTKETVLEERYRSVYYQLQENLRKSNPRYESRFDSWKNQEELSEWVHYRSRSDSFSEYEEESIIDEENNEILAAVGADCEDEGWDDDNNALDQLFDPNLGTPRYPLLPGKYKFGWTPPFRPPKECIVPTSLAIMGFIYVPGMAHTRTTYKYRNHAAKLPVAEGQFEDIDVDASSEQILTQNFWDLLSRQLFMFVRNPIAPKYKGCKRCEKYDDCWHHGVWIVF